MNVLLVIGDWQVSDINQIEFFLHIQDKSEVIEKLIEYVPIPWKAHLQAIDLHQHLTCHILSFPTLSSTSSSRVNGQDDDGLLHYLMLGEDNKSHPCLHLPALLFTDATATSATTSHYHFLHTIPLSLRWLYSLIPSLSSSSSSSSSLIEEQDGNNIALYKSKGMLAYESLDMCLAARSFSQVLIWNAHDSSTLYNLACIYQFSGLTFLAMGMLQELLLDHPEDHIAQTLLWQLAISSPRHGEIAQGIYRLLQEKGKGDLQAGMRLAALTNVGPLAMQGQEDYIRMVFNNLADSFEDKLVHALHYEVPWRLANIVEQYYRSTSLVLDGQEESMASSGIMGHARIVDLGCGSGLCAKTFSSFFSRPGHTTLVEDSMGLPLLLQSLSEDSKSNGWIVGIDLSDRMIAIANNLKLYRGLYTGDIASFIASIIDHNVAKASKDRVLVDIILAADTFIYIGALGQVFVQLSQLVESGACFAFSIEDLEASSLCTSSSISGGSFENNDSSELEWIDGEPLGAVAGWGVRLGRSVRYAHSDRYIHLLAQRNGWHVVKAEREALRMEEGQPVLGYCYLLVRQ